MIKFELKPFTDYGIFPEVGIQQYEYGKRLAIHTSVIKNPLSTARYHAKASIYIKSDDEVWIDGGDMSYLFSELHKLTPRQICDEFCEVNERGLTGLFRTICDYSEGSRASLRDIAVAF